MTCDTIDDVFDQPLNVIKPIKHEVAEYSNLCSKFREKDAHYNNQYCKLYTIRLANMMPLVQERVKSKWGTKHPIVQLHKLQEAPSKKCVIIGTLFKDQKLKPSLLKKISEANSLVPQPIYTHFTDDSDVLFIEDDLQRYQIVGELNVHKLVTGITCALLGTDQGMGKFRVEEFCFADCRAQLPRQMTLTEDRFICFVSGLDLVNYANKIPSLKLFIDWIIGFLGGETVQEEARKICRLIITGNSIRSSAEMKKQTSLVAQVVESSESFNAVQQFDEVLSQFVKFLNVDLMPGEFDPSNHLLAQQPMHHCMFPKASKHRALNCVTNPYQCQIEGLNILGSSGQPINDITAYSRIESPLEALEKCLVWSHIAPTAPDTLGSYPYFSKDPFIIEECPNVFFTGDQSEFQTKSYTGPEGQKIRLICVPKFSETSSIVLLNLNNLDCYDVSFDIMDEL